MNETPNDPVATESDQPVGDDYSEPEFVTPETEQDAEPEPESPYASYDPTQVRETVYDAKTWDLGPLTDEEGNPLPSFDEQYKEDFHGLAFIGALSKTFDYLGHQIVIRTLTIDEALHIAQLTRDFGGTIGDGLAYRTATAALCVEQIDGAPLPQPLGGVSGYAIAQNRFDYARQKWFQYTIDAIYTNYLELEVKTRQVVEAMGKAFGQTA